MSRQEHLTGVAVTIAELDKAKEALLLAEQALGDTLGLCDLHVAGINAGPGQDAIEIVSAIETDVRALLGRLNDARINLADYLERL